MDQVTAVPRYAARCAFLRMTLGRAGGGQLLNLCQHVVREGSACVGPFLDDAETTCGLWELAPGMQPRLAGTDVSLRELPRPW